MKEETNNPFDGMKAEIFNQGSYDLQISELEDKISRAELAFRKIKEKYIPTDIETLKLLTSPTGRSRIFTEAATEYLDKIHCVLPKERQRIIKEYEELGASCTGYVKDLNDLLTDKLLKVTVDANGKLATNIDTVKESIKPQYVSHIDLSAMNETYQALIVLSRHIQAFYRIETTMLPISATSGKPITQTNTPLVWLLTDIAKKHYSPQQFYVRFWRCFVK